MKQMQIDKMDKIERPVLERRKMALELRSAVRGGQRVLALEQTDFAFGEDPVLLDVELVITRGERVGVVGPEQRRQDPCCARVLAGELDPRTGTRWIGDNIEVGYLSQAAGDMPGDRAGDRRAARWALAHRGGGGADAGVAGGATVALATAATRVASAVEERPPSLSATRGSSPSRTPGPRMAPTPDLRGRTWPTSSLPKSCCRSKRRTPGSSTSRRPADTRARATRRSSPGPGRASGSGCGRYVPGVLA